MMYQLPRVRGHRRGPSLKEISVREEAKPIAVVSARSGSQAQHLFTQFVERWRGRSRIVGVIEQPRERPNGECGPGWLRSVPDGAEYSIFQDLGSCSAACTLDPTGATKACEAVVRDISEGCDLAIISKFGKLEAEAGSGLLTVFAAALDAGVPVLTFVAPKFRAQWTAFADPFFCILPAELKAVEAWLDKVTVTPVLSEQWSGAF